MDYRQQQINSLNQNYPKPPNLPQSLNYPFTQQTNQGFQTLTPSAPAPLPVPPPPLPASTNNYSTQYQAYPPPLLNQQNFAPYPRQPVATSYPTGPTNPINNPLINNNNYTYQGSPMASASYQTMPNPGYHERGNDLNDPYMGRFSEKKIRSDFVSKVYSLLSIQLLFTVAVIAVCLFQQDVNFHLKSYGLTYVYSGMGLALLIYFILVCIEPARRSYPINMVLLFVMTLGFSIMVGTLSAFYQFEVVFGAILATAFATVAVMLLAKFSPFDVTTCGCALCVLSMVHLIVTIVLILAVPTKYASITAICLASAGSLLVCLYLMYDLQLIMGGREMELSPEEYVLATILLYVNIINLFQYMLIIIGGASRN